MNEVHLTLARKRKGTFQIFLFVFLMTCICFLNSPFGFRIDEKGVVVVVVVVTQRVK